MRIIYFDCFCGISGDMTVGALLDLGVDFNTFKEMIQSLDITGFDISLQSVKKKGIQAAQFSVKIDPGIHQPHRHLSDIARIIESSELPESVKEKSLSAFRRLAEAEAQVHGTVPEKVHFHEVGAIDSIVDTVGAFLALHLLGPVDKIVSSPLHLGTGTVHAAHGEMPVPAPATLSLLKGVPCYTTEHVTGELVTPTGAVIITEIANQFCSLPAMRIEKSGYGSGMRDLPDRANVLRVIMGETQSDDIACESIAIVESNVDDMTPELLAPLLVDILNEGAVDAFLTSLTGKKGRPAFCITALCNYADRFKIAEFMLRHTTTFGVRMRVEERICLDREWRQVKTSWGIVRVKIGMLHGEKIHFSPEYEDCRKLAQEAAVPLVEIYETVMAAAMRGEFFDA